MERKSEMKTNREVTRFKVEDTLMRIVERYRIVVGVHDCDKDNVTYWIESWLPNTRRWCLTYRYHRWSTLEQLINSSEYRTLMRFM